MRVRTLTRAGIISAVAAVAVAAALALPSTRSNVRADMFEAPFGLYIHRADGRPADPVNVVFIGERDTAAIALRLATALRWTRVEGSDMTFFERGQPRRTEIQSGRGLGPGSRQHIRLTGAREPAESWGPYALAAVHRDLTVPCGHIGVAFDEERNALAAAMGEAGYRVTWLRLGNDGPIEHCGGAVNRGDGWAVVIDLRTGPGASTAR
jgi:hypothetical protein